MNEISLSVILEAIMFTSGRSMSTDELSKIVDKSIDEVESSLDELQSRIKRRQDSALQLTEVLDHESVSTIHTPGIKSTLVAP